MKFSLSLLLIGLVVAAPPTQDYSIEKRQEIFTCPAGATKCEKRMKLALLDIEEKNNYSLGKVYDDNGKELPVYIANVDGQSPGNACNIMRWMVKNYNNDYFFTKDDYIKLIRGVKYDRDQVLAGYKCTQKETNPTFGITNKIWQRDEFPYHDANVVVESIDNDEISVLCIPPEDNEIDGCNLDRFFLASPAKTVDLSNPTLSPYSKADLCVTNDNTHYHPNQASSTPRDFKIEDGQAFAVIANTKNINGCKAFL